MLTDHKFDASELKNSVCQKSKFTLKQTCIYYCWFGLKNFRFRKDGSMFYLHKVDLGLIVALDSHSSCSFWTLCVCLFFVNNQKETGEPLLVSNTCTYFMCIVKTKGKNTKYENKDKTDKHTKINVW